MRGIPQTLIIPLQKVLMDCDEFYNQRQLRQVFSVPELLPWQNRLPWADNLQARVSGIIGYLVDQNHVTSGNALVLMLRILGKHYYPDTNDERHARLLAIAEQIEWYKNRSQEPEGLSLEANPQNTQMLWIADVEKMLTSAQSVARIEVPRYRNAQQLGISSGTAWLITPNLAITCWHVVEVLSNFETSVDPLDMQAQFTNTTLTFDYTIAGKGIQYGISAVEYPTTKQKSFDYVILRILDRADAPITDRGYLTLDAETPLNSLTNLYIIQHPLGQAQQNSGGNFIKYSLLPNRILYSTPTEPGTSGAPVFNRVNWRVVALHNGENKSEHLREGTTMKSILSNIQQIRPDLHDEIMAAQIAGSKG